MTRCTGKDVCDVLQERIRTRLVYLRKEAGLSVADIAKSTELNIELLEKIENGEAEVTVPVLLKIMSVFANIVDEN